MTGYGTSTVLGGPATAGAVVLTASLTTAVVTIDLDAACSPRSMTGNR